MIKVYDALVAFTPVGEKSRRVLGEPLYGTYCMMCSMCSMVWYGKVLCNKNGSCISLLTLFVTGYWRVQNKIPRDITQAFIKVIEILNNTSTCVLRTIYFLNSYLVS